MLRINLLLFLGLVWGINVIAQEVLPVSAIPDSLKENSYSVVRYKNTEYTWQTIATGDETSTRIITILNDKGKEEANFVCYCDNFQDLKKFSGEVYDANGKLIRKIKKSDLILTEYSTNLASDGKMYYYECTMPYYPFTIKYEWEMKHKNGIIGFPVFSPQNSYNQSVEKASYHLYTPDGLDFKVKNINFESPYEKEIAGKFTKHTWEIKARKAIEAELFGPSLSSLVPVVLITPTKFVFDKIEGNLTDWNSYGAFQYGLLKGRDQLPANLIQKVKELTANAETDKEKVKIIYDYLAETTRYVSIQLGIGGFQPMPALEVAATGFGDCKALSNYVMAILRELDIPSCYTIISTKNRRLLADFPSANQMNHAILQVPLPEDTLWLECTNAEFPFGYVHEDIAGHDALLLKETGGELYRLPTYPDSLNMENHEVEISLSEDGKISAKVNYNVHLFQYESMKGFDKISSREQIDYLRKQVYVSQARISDVKFTENKSSHPSINIEYKVESEQFGSKTGNRLFLPVNAFRKGFGKLSNKQRKHDIYIHYGYSDNDNVTFSIPENYEIEALPKPILISKEYGTFVSLITAGEGKINVIQSLRMKPGRYSATEYSEFVEFCNTVSKGYNNRIILKKL